MLVLRILSALVGIPLILFLTWHGGFYLIALCTLIMFLSLLEIKRMLLRFGLNVPFGLMITVNFLLSGSVYIYKERLLIETIVIIFFIFLLCFMFFYQKYSLIDISVAFLSSCYIGLFIYVYLLRTLPDGWIWVILMLTGTWVSDTFAYFTGKAFGQNPLAKALSPGKTIEGALGGLAGGIFTAFAFKYFYPFLNETHLIVLGFLLGIAAQIGDLVESAVKRQVGVKDAGDIIPGHGGMLDRFDSMFFTAPLVYYYVQKLFLS